MPDFRPQEGAQSLFLSSPADIAIYGGSAGSGKRISIDTPIATEHGWKTMGTVAVGDRVFSIDGSLSTVTTISPIELAEDSYEVEFDTGEIIVADGDHLWKTMTINELKAFDYSNKDREFKVFPYKWYDFVPTSNWHKKYSYEERCTIAKLRSSGCSVNEIGFLMNRTPCAIEQQINKKIDSFVKTKECVTTKDIMNTLLGKGRVKSRNHCIPLCDPIQYSEQTYELPIDPWLFGYLLGDGDTSGSGRVACHSMDIDFLCEKIKNLGYNTRKSKDNIHFYLYGIQKAWRSLCLHKGKFIPEIYSRSSVQQRINLIKGLIDSDGNIDSHGGYRFTNINKDIVDGFCSIVASLGLKPRVFKRERSRYLVKSNDSYEALVSSNIELASIPRKLSKARHKWKREQRCRYIVDVRQTSPRLMRCIAIDHPSHLYLVGRTFIPTHNTVALLLEAARHVDVPGYNAVIFRREFKQVVSSGGIRDAALQIYPFIGGVYRSQPTPQFLFNPGAKISFAHLNTEAETLAWQGSEICMIGFDELSHYTYYQFEYLLSRNRSTCGVRPLVRATTNPDADSWVKDFISWWIDEETGFPIKERSGKLRYMIRVDGVRKWGNSVKELVDTYDCDPMDAKSVTFVSAKITDNPILLRKDPGYLANLKALDKVERARLLEGNWKIRAEAGMYFPRDDAVIIDWDPGEVIKWIRSWDLAASEASESRDPDWTVGILGGRKSDGNIVIADVIRLRRKADYIEQLIRNVAFQDGKDTWICIPQDPGAAGKAISESYQRLLSGFTIISRSITKNKVMMASAGAYSPAALWQKHQIELVRAPWNKTLIDELDAFPTRGVHDDQCFVAGTMIATEFGSIPIESIVPGMYVWTRKGWRKVLESKLTNHLASVVSVRFANGTKLTGTANHPVICKDNSIVKLQDLSDCDNLVWLEDTAYSVTKHSLLHTNTQDSVRNRALQETLTQEGLEKVYNLSVEGENEYFANGVLVHNCDALAALVRNLPGHVRPDYSQSGLSGKFKPFQEVRRTRKI